MTTIRWPFDLPTVAAEASFQALERALALLPDETAYREMLWQATLDHVAAVPRYAGGRGRGLADFGLLTAADVTEAEHRHDLYHPDIPRQLLFSSGGTSGRSKLMPHAYAQFAAMSLLEEATVPGSRCRAAGRCTTWRSPARTDIRCRRCEMSWSAPTATRSATPR
jgi:hypothetical protein